MARLHMSILVGVLLLAGCEESTETSGSPGGDTPTTVVTTAHDVQKTWTIHVRSNQTLQPIAGATVLVYIGDDTTPAVQSVTDAGGDVVETFYVTVYEEVDVRNCFEIQAWATGFAVSSLLGSLGVAPSNEFTLYLIPLP